MANGHGGHRTPSNPAPVSGPGALSQRTDGGPADGQAVMRLPDAAYGESAEFEALQQGAPVHQAAPIDLSGLVPMSAPSQYAERPVTDGAVAYGGSDIAEQLDEEDLLRLSNYLPVLKQLASQPYASNATRQMVRQLIALQPER